MTLESIKDIYEFLQGNAPEGVFIPKGHQPKLSPKKAMSIIWFLQEVSNVLPSNIERCDSCNELFDMSSDGLYWESKSKFYCGGCCYLVPRNYDRGKR